MKKPRKRKQRKPAPLAPEPAAPAPIAIGSARQTPVPESRTVVPQVALEVGGEDEAEPVAATPQRFPVLLVALLGLLIYQGDIYLMQHSGAFSPLVYYPYEQVPEPPGAGDVVKRGQNIYGRNCAACHQPNGAGNAALGFPPLAGSEWVQAEGPNRIIRIVLNGLAGPIQVNGQQYNNVMVPWRDTMTDDEIAAVLTFVRQAWGNNASPVKPDQVTAIRRATESRGRLNWTAQELLAIPVKD